VQNVGWATGISKLHTTSIKRTYMEGSRRGVVAGSERACKEGEESKVLEMPCVDCGLGNTYQQSTYSICKRTYMEGGPNEVRTSLRGRGGVQGPRGPINAVRRRHRHQQSVHRTCKTYVHAGWSSRVPNELAREGRSPRS
jgi:hypothetical protein